MTFEDFIAKVYAELHNESWLTVAFLNPDTHKEKKKASGYDNGFTFSVTWNLGGTYGTCWDDEKHPVSGEAEPDGPVEFDKILEALCPNLTFMQYKGITSEVIKRGETHHSDYYGGSTTEAYKGFYIEDLYESLKGRHLI